MYEKTQFSRNFYYLFGTFLSFFPRSFPEGVITRIVPKMLERSPINFNSTPTTRTFDSGKTDC